MAVLMRSESVSMGMRAACGLLRAERAATDDEGHAENRIGMVPVQVPETRAMY